MPTFKVLRGIHRENGKNYHKGDRIRTKHDLLKFNSTGSIKFQKIDDKGPDDESPLPPADPVPTNEGQPADDDGLESMTVEELRQFAAGEEIDIGGSRTKADIIAKIRAA